MKRLSIIIVSYNTSELLYNCLESLNPYLHDKSVEVFVVDNNSKDDSVEMVKKKFPQVIIIENNENLGFAKANNQAINKSSGEYIFLLNSDTQDKNNAIEILANVLDDNKKVSIIGPKLINADASIQPSAGVFYNLWITFLWLLGFERLGLLKYSPTKQEKVDWVSGAAFMIRKSTIDTIGLLDEHFFMYLEEMEWCYRARKKGYMTYFEPSAEILHKGLGSGNKAFAVEQIYKGLLYFFKIHKSMLELSIVYVLLLLKARIAIALGIVLRNKGLISTYTQAAKSL